MQRTTKNKNPGGNKMSLKKSSTRLSLLAGSSLMLSALAFSGVALAPASALAANECGNPSANGASPDILTCTPGAYPAGIDYSTTSNGSLTVILRDRVDTGTSNTAGVGGVRMFGKTGESMTLLREDTPSVVGDPRIINTAGRGVDVTTQGVGNVLINLTDGDPTAGEPTTPAATAPAPMRLTGGTDAIRGEATGTGSVSVIIAETGTASGTNHPRAIITAGANVGSNGSGVVARSTSGAINVDTRGATFTINGTNGGSAIDAVSTSGNVTVSTFSAAGRVRGILAQTGGSGTISVTTTGAVSANATTGLAGIDTVAGTGATTINISGNVSGGAGAAIRSVSASTSATSAVSVQQTGGTVTGRLDFSGVNAGGVIYNLNGTSTGFPASWDARGASTFTAFNDTVTIGGNAIFLTAANAAINLGAGNDTFTVNGTSLTSNTLAAGTVINFGDGNDTFNFNAPRSRLAGVTLNFGAGTDAMSLGGLMIMQGLTITGVDTLDFTGVILMGGAFTGVSSNPVYDFVNTDSAGDDVLVMTEGTWNGAGGRVVMDVRIDLPQEDCATLTGAADCLDLRGASSSGETLVTLNYIGAGSTLGAFSTSGITLVDMAGTGTSAQSHFVIDPDTAGYGVDPMFGGVLTRAGLFSYGIRYDAENQRHVLTGLPRSEVLEYAMLSGAAQSIWHMTTDAVTDRQMDMRKATDGGSVWLRTAGEYTQREVATAFDSFGEAFTFDNSYKLYAGTVMGGMDLITGTSGEYDYVLGGQIGYVASSFDLNASETSGRFSGATGGVYGSAWSNRFFLDGTFNMNGLTLDYEAPGLGSKTNTFVNSIGARLDGGMRWMLGARTFVEPLATLAFASTSFEEISLSGGEVQPENANSRRGALGVRLGADLTEGPINVGYFVAGRAWNEFAGQADGVVSNPGEDLLFTDEFTGGFGEAEAGLNLFNESGSLSGFLSSGVKFKNGYDAVNLSLGLNMRW